MANARTTWLVLGATVVAVLWVAGRNEPAGGGNAPTAAQLTEALAAQERQREQARTESAREQCRASRDSMRRVAAESRTNSELDGSATALKRCAALTGDAELMELGKATAARGLVLEATDSSKSPRARRLAVEALEENSASLYAKYRHLIPQMERAEAAAEARELRSRGVTLGMTAEDVLRSSWGRPERVNKTTTSSGTREQWVYRGGYLYFDNGVLTTIQH